MGALLSLIPIIGPLLAALVGGNGTTVTIRGPRITDFNSLTSKYGLPIPKGYGTYRFAGNYIWLSAVTEIAINTKTCQTTGSFFGIGGSDQCTVNVTYEYYQSVAIAFSAGTDAKLLKLWTNGALAVDLTDSTLENVNGLISQNRLPGGLETHVTFYDGNNTEIDPTIAEAEGAENTPLYNDIIYLVVNNLHLKPYGNALPVISASIAYDGTGTKSGTKATITPALTATGSLYVNSNEVYSQTSTQYEVIDALIPGSIVTYPYITATSFDVPYADIFGRVYSSSLYTGSDSELIQYDKNSGIVVSRRSLELLASPLKALTFDYPNALVFGIGDSGTFYFDIFADVIKPVITTQLDKYTKIKASVATIGDTAEDIYYRDNIVYAIRTNAASPKETYLIVYRQINSYEGEVFGPLIHADHTNSFDASTTLEAGSFISVPNSETIVVGSASADWLITLDTATITVNTYSTSFTLDARDRSNFITAAGNTLNLSSGDIIKLPSLTLDENNDILTLFSLSSYDFAMWADPLNGYIVYDGTQVSSAYLRNNSAAQALDTIVSDIITLPQNEVGPKLTVADLDISNLTTSTVKGYTLTQQAQISQQLDPIKQVFAFELVESDGKLKSTLRTQTSQATILDSETSSISTDGGDFGVNIGRTQETEMIKTVTVTYSDEALDFQPGTQSASRITNTAVDVKNIQIDLVASADEMSKAADVLLEDSWLIRENYSTVVNRKYFFLDPADIVTFITAAGDSLEFRITRISLADNGLIELSAVSNRAGIYTSGAIGFVGQGEKQLLQGLENITIQTFDIPYIYPDGSDSYSVYVAALSDAAADYSIQTTQESAVSGTGSISNTSLYTNTLDAYGIVTDFKYKGASTSSLYFTTFKDKNDAAIEVQVLNGVALTSIVDKDTMFLNQQNFILLANELLYFATATDLGSGKYTLSGLTRFVQGVNNNTQHSNLGDSFRIIDRDSLLEISIGSNRIGEVVGYTAVSSINPSNVSPSTSTEFEAKASLPLPVTRVTSAMATDDIVVSWSRRDRINENWDTYTALVMSEETEKYSIEILDSEGVAVRTASSTTPTYTYLVADQVTDFSAAQDTVLFRVYQVSTLNTNGFPMDYVHNRNGDLFSDFEADTVGVQAPATTKTWTTTNVTYNVVAGKYLQIANTVLGYKAVSFDDKQVTLDTRVKMKAKFSGAGGTDIVGTYIVIHGTSDSGIIAYVTDDLTKIGIAYNNNGTLENDVTLAVTIQEDVFYHIKTEVRDGTVLYKLWKAHLSEPNDWTLVARIDKSFIGFSGVGQNSTSLTIDIDHIQIEGI